MKLIVVLTLAFVGYACADFLPAIELPQDVLDIVAPKATPVHPKDLVGDVVAPKATPVHPKDLVGDVVAPKATPVHPKDLLVDVVAPIATPVHSKDLLVDVVAPIATPVHPKDLVGDVVAPKTTPVHPKDLLVDLVAPKATPVHPKDLVVEDVLPEERITNGWKANEGQLPYQAGLRFSSGQGLWWCGGSLIGQSWILTAAHCTNGAHSVTVYLGSTRRAQARWSTTVNSGNFRQHPHYTSGKLHNDIALINIPAVGYSNFIRNVALPPFAWEHEQFIDHWATASGWGYTHDGSGLPDDLQYAYLQVIDNGACSRVYGGDVVSDTTLCVATPNGISTCSGDSGGPLVVYGYDKLIGVNSFGATAGCQLGYPAGFARVSKHLDWIRGHTGITG